MILAIIMVSRLDRLFILLDTGSNESIRLAAAKQLGEVQRVQPNELNYLLKRIKEYSCKGVWETRVAAGHATRCVLEQVEPWPRQLESDQIGDTRSESILEIEQQPALAAIFEEYADTERILQSFDLVKVVSVCPTLLSMNSIEEDDLDPVNASKAKRGTKSRSSSASRITKKKTKEQLMRQRQLINKELGISMADSLNLGVSSTDIVSNDDLQGGYTTDGSDCLSPSARSNNSQLDVKKTLESYVSNYERVINKLSESGIIKEIEQEAEESMSARRWPLEDIAREYVEGLFDHSWEVRHGSAIALREIVRLHGRSAGRRSDLSDGLNDKLNQLWLLDMVLKTLCVLSLDRFGDFLFDQVVAPVRENAAQLLGCCVATMTENNSSHIMKILLKLLEHPRWETRHGGILGLKYSLNVLDKKALSYNLQICFDAIFKCLGDLNDDVSAEAAASLLPVNDILNEVIPDRTPKLIKFLWEHIAELDELTTSTSNIILLLASLITSNSAHIGPIELVSSVPKLWPLLSHSSTNVRLSVLKALYTLIKPQKTSCLNWMNEDLLVTALRLIFQRSVLENVDEVRPFIQDVWSELIRIDYDESLAKTGRLNLLKYTSQYLNYWLCLCMQPSNVPVDRGNTFWLNIKPDGSKSEIKPEGEVYIASCTFNAETVEQQRSQTTKCRLLSTKLLGALYANLVQGTRESQHTEDILKYLSEMFTHYLRAKSANQRMISGWAIESWAYHQAQQSDCDLNKVKDILPPDLLKQLNLSIQETNLCYDELAPNITRLQHEAREFVGSLVVSNITTDLPYSKDRRIIYNLNQLQSMCDMNIGDEFSKITSKKRDASQVNSNNQNNDNQNYEILTNKQLSLAGLFKTTKVSQKNYSVSVLSSLACALISWNSLPEKLKLIGEPLLDSIETETELPLLNKSIKYLIRLIDSLCNAESTCQQLVEIIIDRLVDTLVQQSNNTAADDNKIVQLDYLQRKAETTGRALLRRESSVNCSFSVKRSHPSFATNPNEFNGLQEQNINMIENRCRGANLALSEIAKHFGPRLPKELPTLWSNMTNHLQMIIVKYKSQTDSTETINEIIKYLIILDTVGESLHGSLRESLLTLYPNLIELLTSKKALIRHHSSRCIGTITKLMFGQVKELIVNQIMPMLERDDDVIARCGSIETAALIIENLQLDLVPKINMFMVQILRRMSDQNDQVRLMATHCFGKLLSLMPLNPDRSKENENATDSIKAETVCSDNVDQDEFKFVEQLLNPKKITHYNIPFETRVQLRNYQQEGLNWLAFLNRFNLHGILCDEMGLGKTFMTICMVASDHFNKDVKSHGRPLPSLIICPATLIEHWLYEIEKFVPSKTRAILNPVGYTGSIGNRMSLRTRIYEIFNSRDCEKSVNEKKKPMNIVITSYDVLRNDIDFFKTITWNYCVLDEGHIIKNGRTKLSRAIRLLTAAHRLILSGTPIQNNVTELWSLFDFLMPGFLGSERQFNSRYTKPILQSREPKCSSRDLEAGALAMESLHRQVLPFILRRLKDDVLDDLPPKIIQDYYCELSPLQSKLYEDFTRSKLCKEMRRKSLNQIEGENIGLSLKSGTASHVFQALQYLKNVCNHPKLVLTPNHSQYSEVRKMLDSEPSSLDDIAHSSKLKALKQLLIDCGIGVANLPNEETSSSQHQLSSSPIELESIVNQHRALIFCQLRSMVDIIENDLFKKHLSNVTYLKLDGSVPTNQRQSIVSRFNNDPSIDVLLLTTHIGGLGLNLTGADTVIFVEHDWNPTRDLQAMDRAHRIGQKKVVNVYRLITKSTLEEKIMGLQKFKTMVSSTVINQDNTGLGMMNVDQLLDLFDNKSDGNSEKTSDGQPSKNQKTNIIDVLPELWDQQQYDTEYDLSSFVSSLKS